MDDVMGVKRPFGRGLAKKTSARRQVVYIALITLLLLLSESVMAQEKPRRIKVLATGKSMQMPVIASWLIPEPSTDPLLVPTRVTGAETRDQIRRLMRIYFPRNYDDFLKYEFFFMAQVDMTFFSSKQQKWFYDALTYHEKGGVNTRSVMSTHSWFHEPWRDSIVSKAFPNDVDAFIADVKNKDTPWGPLIIKDDTDLPNIMKPYKGQIEPIFTQYGGLNTVPRPGSVILSYTKNDAGIGHPIPGQVAHIFYWKWNRSITFTFRDMVTNEFWWGAANTPRANPFSHDIVVNVIWFSTGRSLPEDVMKVHNLRGLLYEFGIRKSLLISLLEFAERFGANPSREYSKLGLVEDIRNEGAENYLDRDFDAAYESIKTAVDELKSLESEAVRLKDSALFWVYVVEWLVTTGVLLAAGVVVWSLMVRRALYREVETTKLVG